MASYGRKTFGLGGIRHCGGNLSTSGERSAKKGLKLVKAANHMLNWLAGREAIVQRFDQRQGRW